MCSISQACSFTLKELCCVDYLKHGDTITGAYYIDLIGDVRTALKERRWGKLSRRMLFHQDNTCAHTSSQALGAIRNSGRLNYHTQSPYSLFSIECWVISVCKEILKRTQFYWWCDRYVYGKWLAQRVRTIILLQWNPCFGESLDEVHVSCRKLCWIMTKRGMHMQWLTVSG